jgi:group II intron reverse transcriptase/maturase
MRVTECGEEAWSEAHSYGFRPGRSAHDAVLAAQSYVQSGRRIVVDVDLEKFFDRVNHDILIDRLQKRIGDTGVIRLIRAYLTSGIMGDGVVQMRTMGTPQGGPLSPLLANVLLDEVDKALERRGHCFVRYADDANVYVRSRRAGERVMALLRRLYGKLRLTVNETKSAVTGVFGRKFLGYSFWVAPGGVIKRKVADKPLRTFKQRNPATDLPQWRAQYAGCGGSSAALHPGMEGVLPAGANTTGLARARPVAASPAARHPAQALEARHDHVPGIAGAGSQA